MIRQVGIMKAQMKNLQEGQDILIEAQNRDPPSKRAQTDEKELSSLRGILPIKTLNDMDNFLAMVNDEKIADAVVRESAFFLS